MKVIDRIDRFCGYFRNQVECIGNLQINPDVFKNTDNEANQVRFYKKVLLISAIDTLAGIRFPKETYPQLNKKNQERFIKFITDSDIWPEGNLVSIPFLAEHVSTGKISKGKLLDFINGHMSKSPDNHDFSIAATEIDVQIEKLLTMVKTEQEEKVIRENQHYELLYRYRNYLIHEAREPGKAMDITLDNIPYYHGYIGDKKLYLAYPVGMFEVITTNSIHFIENYTKQNSIDPYDFVTETTRW